MKEHRISKISWRRKYFANEKSWRLYLYACRHGIQLNRYLRKGRELKDHKSKIISSDDRFIFTREGKPFLGIGDRWYLRVEHTPEGIFVLENRADISKRFKNFKWLSSVSGKGFINLRYSVDI